MNRPLVLFVCGTMIKMEWLGLMTMRAPNSMTHGTNSDRGRMLSPRSATHTLCALVRCAAFVTAASLTFDARAGCGDYVHWSGSKDRLVSQMAPSFRDILAPVGNPAQAPGPRQCNSLKCKGQSPELPTPVPPAPSGPNEWAVAATQEIDLAPMISFPSPVGHQAIREAHGRRIEHPPRNVR